MLGHVHAHYALRTVVQDLEHVEVAKGRRGNGEEVARDGVSHVVLGGTGDVPEGREQHPAAGISWFEARAYCRWAKRELPTLWHWNRAAETRLSAMVVPKSNFVGAGTSPVGEYPGRTAFGLADMGGNVREWCRNSTANGERVILGGGWDDRPYMFNLPPRVVPLVM